MSNDVSRRNFVALAGAGLALTACRDKTSNDRSSGPEARFTKSDLVEFQTKSDVAFSQHLKAGRGWKYPHHGNDPNEPRSYYEVSNPTGIIKKVNLFNPQFFHIISIEDGSKNSSDPKKRWSIDINHAHFSFASTFDDEITNNARLKKAIEILENKKPGLFSATTNSNRKPFNRKKLPEIDYAEDILFSKLKYGSKHEIFIYIDGPFIGLESKSLISFAPNRNPSGVAKENFSFYGAEIVPLNSMGSLWDKGRIIRLRNYFEDANGDPVISTDEMVYSMNIHIGVPNGTNGSVPMVIDPDTGNGMGNNP